MFDRKSVIVYFRNPKVLKHLKQYGNLAYYHKKRRYAVMYVDADALEKTMKQIQVIRNVRRVEVSPLYDMSLFNDDLLDTKPELSSENT
ncbi:MAG: DUF2129 domain-containing protein [Acholeplasmatales bacterium]|nr:MAG: DUF2129 domain-containing protein [Acholeplasmatales bacterium]